MAQDDAEHEAPTRRDYMKYGGAVVGGGLLAGCTGDGDAASTPTATDGASDVTETQEEQSGSYEVCMSPVGCVEFEDPPEKIATYSNQYADMAVAFGQKDALQSIGFNEYWMPTYDRYYGALPGVEFDTTELTPLWNDGMDKELFYELNSDVILMDPLWTASFQGWDRDDVTEIKENVAPFFGNRYSREHNFEGTEYFSTDEYTYYSAWELYGNVSEVFNERKRWSALKSIRDEMVSTIGSQLPREEDAPSVGLVYFSDGEFSPYRLYHPGWGQSQYHHLNATDVFADSDRTYSENKQSSYDYEAMLELDPDIILQFSGTNFPEEGDGSFKQSILEPIQNHPVGQELTAAQTDRIYPGGTAFQGPIWNIIQIEIAAKQIYPGAFGEFHMPAEVPEEEQLFDRQRVADIINGDI